MFKKILGFLTVFYVVGSVMVVCARADANPVDETCVYMGNITVDALKQEIRIKTRLAIKHGILEFLLVGDRGKTYESVLKIENNNPSDLHTALLLLGVKPIESKRFQEAFDKKNSAESFLKAFPQSTLTMEIRHKGHAIDLDKLIKSREKGKEINNVWVFTGSFFTKNGYAADLGRSYISVWPDPSAVINLYSNHGNPYKGQFGFRMHGMHPWNVDEAFEIVLRPPDPTNNQNKD
ncbi:MAG: YdjY domain-containing protein [bacterium]